MGPTDERHNFSVTVDNINQSLMLVTSANLLTACFFRKIQKQTREDDDMMSLFYLIKVFYFKMKRFADGLSWELSLG